MNTTTTWTADEITIVIEAAATIIVRLNNTDAEALYNKLSVRAADTELYNKDGVFTIGHRSYEFTAGQWASVYRTLADWYEQHFDAHFADDVFGDSTPFMLHAIK